MGITLVVDAFLNGEIPVVCLVELYSWGFQIVKYTRLLRAQR